MGEPAPARRTSRRATRDLALARVSAALERLLAGGVPYSEVTVEAIAREAGMAKSTFYFHFEDRASVLVATTEHLQVAFLGTMDRWLHADFPVGLEALEASLQALVAQFRAHADLLSAVVEAAGREPAAHEVWLAAVDRTQRGITAHLAKGREAGSLDPALDPSRTAAWVTWTLESGLRQVVRGVDDATAERAAGTLALLLWRALYAPPT